MGQDICRAVDGVVAIELEYIKISCQSKNGSSKVIGDSHLSLLKLHLLTVADRVLVAVQHHCAFGQ